MYVCIDWLISETEKEKQREKHEFIGQHCNQQSYPVRACIFCFLKMTSLALASVAPWIESWPANQRVAISIPSQGTRPGSQSGLQLGVNERQPHIDVSLPSFLSPFPLSLKINK